MSSSRDGPAGESAFIASLNRSPIPMSSKTYRLDFAKTPTQPGQGLVPKISLELCNRLSVYPSRSLVRLHTFESFPDLPFGDLERLRLVHGLLPFPVGPWPRLNNAAPSLQLHYKAFVATTGCSVPTLRVGTLALAVGAACGLSLHATNEKRAA